MCVRARARADQRGLGGRRGPGVGGSVPRGPAGGGQGPRVEAAVGDASSLLLRFLSS